MNNTPRVQTGDGLPRRIVDALGLPEKLPNPDKYRMQADPALLRDVVTAMAALLPPDTEVLAGVELGGVPVAIALSLHTGIPAAIVRRTATRSGCSALAGASVVGRRAVLVADMVQGGGKLRPAVETLRDAGARVEDAVVAVYWYARAVDTASRVGVRLHAAVTARDVASVSGSGA